MRDACDFELVFQAPARREHFEHSLWHYKHQMFFLTTSLKLTVKSIVNSSKTANITWPGLVTKHKWSRYVLSRVLANLYFAVLELWLSPLRWVSNWQVFNIYIFAILLGHQYQHNDRLGHASEPLRHWGTCSPKCDLFAMYFIFLHL